MESLGGLHEEADYTGSGGPVSAHNQINPTLPRIALGAKSDASARFPIRREVRVHWMFGRGGGRSRFEPAGRISFDSQALGVRRIKRFLVLGVGLIVGALRVEVGLANGRPVILRLAESIGKQ
jgi:hypothetical protein